MLQTDSTLPGITILEFNSAGHIALCRGTGLPSVLASTASKFAIGCIYVDTTTGLSYSNIGTVALPSFKATSGITAVSVKGATIATTSNTDEYVIVPESGVLDSIDFSGIDALAAHDSNYITWTVTNLGQAGSGTTAMLLATLNNTKVTGGTALSANTKRSFSLSATPANLVVAAGDRLLIRAAATGTLANTVTGPIYCLRFKPSV